MKLQQDSFKLRSARAVHNNFCQDCNLQYLPDNNVISCIIFCTEQSVCKCSSRRLRSPNEDESSSSNVDMSRIANTNQMKIAGRNRIFPPLSISNWQLKAKSLIFPTT